MSGGEVGPEEWGERYEQCRPVYSAYTEALTGLIPRLLDQDGVSYVQIDGRTKERPNFVAKLRRKGEKYEDPLAEVTDLSGIRVVLYYLDDVEAVGRLVQRHFMVDAENSVDKGALLDPDRFGYLSAHYVVKPTAARCDLPEWAPFEDLSAEIQVRTVLQHAWGAISRKLAYASVREAPRDLQRNLNRLSALLELADDEFVDIRLAREEIEQQYDREVERGNLDLNVDESSLEIYLRESGVADRLSRLAEEAGSGSVQDSIAIWGEERFREVRQEEIRDLMNLLGRLGIEQISELDAKLEGLWDGIPGFIRTVNERYLDPGDVPISAVPEAWLILILLWAAEAPVESYLDLNYVQELIEVVVSTYRSPPS